QDRYTTEIIVNEMTMLGGKSSSGGSFEVVENKPAASSGAAPSKAAPAAKSSFDNFDDDIPF
ncbi:MAG TPA: single-stranded DNA-binding protein, partial [Gallionella sp.]|nr:single-stranded DNA-binding protein [Gallionella sp.]